MKLYSILEFSEDTIKRGGMYSKEKMFIGQFFEVAKNEEEAEKKVLKKIKKRLKSEYESQIEKILRRGNTPNFTVETTVKEVLEETVLDVHEVIVDGYEYEVKES